MKKKENSLFDKLRKENQANKVSANVLSEIIPSIDKLKPQTILTSKIEEIKKLQSDDRLDSSNKIFEILNTHFDYTYPFYFVVNTSNADYSKKLDKSILSKKDNLISHIKSESNLNTLKSKYIETTNLIEQKINLDNTPVTSKGKLSAIALAILGLPIAYLTHITIYSNFDQNSSNILYSLFGNLLMLAAFTTYIFFPIIGYRIGEGLFNNKEENKIITKNIDKNLLHLKTKANN
jgi:hypothetical protein